MKAQVNCCKLFSFFCLICPYYYCTNYERGKTVSGIRNTSWISYNLLDRGKICKGCFSWFSNVVFICQLLFLNTFLCLKTLFHSENSSFQSYFHRAFVLPVSIYWHLLLFIYSNLIFLYKQKPTVLAFIGN